MPDLFVLFFFSFLHLQLLRRDTFLSVFLRTPRLHYLEAIRFFFSFRVYALVRIFIPLSVYFLSLARATLSSATFAEGKRALSLSSLKNDAVVGEVQAELMRPFADIKKKKKKKNRAIETPISHGRAQASSVAHTSHHDCACVRVRAHQRVGAGDSLETIFLFMGVVWALLGRVLLIGR